MEVVAGVQQTPPRVSLISSADLVPVEGERWYDGFVADSDGIGSTETVPVCDAGTFTSDNENRGMATYKPYVLYSSEKGSTYGNVEDLTKAFDRAQRALLAGESYALESILWDGYAGELNKNPFLSDGAGAYTPDAGATCDNTFATSEITSSVTSVRDALAVLEQKIGDAGSGQRGMVHIRPQAFHALVVDYIVRREGNVWLTPMDNIIVPGRGYAGTGPAGQAVGATEWMYGHVGIVQIRRGAIVRLGEGDPASIITRPWNDYNVVVQRVAHVLLPTVGAPVYAIDFNSLG